VKWLRRKKEKEKNINNQTTWANKEPKIVKKKDQLLDKDEKKNALEYTQYRLEKQEKMYKCLH